jgi:hypothetical protein
MRLLPGLNRPEHRLSGRVSGQPFLLEFRVAE